MTIPGYVLNDEENDFYYVSISRLHAAVSGPSSAVTLESTKTASSLLCSTPFEEAREPWAWPASESKPGLETGEFLGLSNQVHNEVRGWRNIRN